MMGTIYLVNHSCEWTSGWDLGRTFILHKKWNLERSNYVRVPRSVCSAAILGHFMIYLKL